MSENDVSLIQLNPIAPETPCESGLADLFPNATVPMLNGTPLRRFAMTATRNIAIDTITGDAAIEQDGFKAFFAGYSKLKGGLQTSTSKLLDMLCIELTKTNQYKPPKGTTLNTLVSIPLNDYLVRKGYDIEPRPTTTDEEAEAERQRIENVYHYERKKINADLNILYSLSLSWKEPKRRKGAQDFVDVRIIQSKAIKNGCIYARFGDDIADYLTHAYVMQYPQALFALDEGNQNRYAYSLGRELASRASNDNNAASGTANIISVRSALEYCAGLPTYEEVQQKDRGHWEHRIKEPLELALDNLVSDNVLASWEYCNSKCAALTDAQIAMSDYETFSSLYIHYEMAVMPDQTERRKRREEEKAAKEAKQLKSRGRKPKAKQE